MGRSKQCEIVEVELPEITDSGLASVIDLIAQLIARDIIREHESVEGDRIIGT